MSLDLLGKSPKMWVNEITVKQLVQAKWDTKEAFPGQSPPTFICTCRITYSDRVLEAEGSGKTKKDAEQEAARSMLFTKLEMTPAKLMQLNAAAKKKEKFGGGSHSSSNGLVQDAGDGDRVDETDEVSDTDDKEMEAAGNPIGELMAICTVNEFDDPEYYEIKAEGPPHKRVFTMGCKVGEVNVMLTGRRHKKQMAKKLAAFRVLREMKKLGYEYNSFADRNGEPGEVDVPSNSAADGVTLNEVKSKLEGLSISKSGRFERSIVGLTEFGDIGCCNEEPDKCLEYCVDYSHAFHHLPKSETLNELEVQIQNNPDSMSLLKKVAGELEIRLTIYNGADLDGKIVFIGLKLPFKFNLEVPNKSVVHGVGRTDEEAKNNAAIEALNFLNMMVKT